MQRIRSKIFIALNFPEGFLNSLMPDLLAYSDIQEVKVYANGLEIFFDSTYRQEMEVVSAVERVLGRRGYALQLTED